MQEAYSESWIQLWRTKGLKIDHEAPGSLIRPDFMFSIQNQRSISEVSVNPLFVEGALVPIAPVLLLFSMCDLSMLSQYNP